VREYICKDTYIHRKAALLRAWLTCVPPPPVSLCDVGAFAAAVSYTKSIAYGFANTVAGTLGTFSVQAVDALGNYYTTQPVDFFIKVRRRTEREMERDADVARTER
jgi:hypothetical protein